MPFFPPGSATATLMQRQHCSKTHAVCVCEPHGLRDTIQQRGCTMRGIGREATTTRYHWKRNYDTAL
eukprot:15435062-Alexandrium_andersonii.AAC.1